MAVSQAGHQQYSNPLYHGGALQTVCRSINLHIIPWGPIFETS